MPSPSARPSAATSLADRLARHRVLAAALAAVDDAVLLRLLGAAPVTGSGIGGTTGVLDIDDLPVFAKRVALTQRELAAADGSTLPTANLFDLPLACQHGIGSPGFGVGRELVAHLRTTIWVEDGSNPGFPLLHHWRVLDGGAPRWTAVKDVEDVVAFWDGSPAVRQRLRALADAPASVVLVLEHLPHTLDAWLAEQHHAGPEALEAAIAMVERSLLPSLERMNAAGLWHFDVHLENLLTDGSEVFVGDLGLATSPLFDLSAAERAFLTEHEGFDVALARARIANWLVTALCEVEDPIERDAVIGRIVEGRVPAGLPAWAVAVLQRHAPVGAVVNAFIRALHTESRTVPYPLAAIRLAGGS